jgi:hypothetical protein
VFGFAHLFQPIKLEGDESSSSADEGKDGSEQVGASKKGRGLGSDRVVVLLLLGAGTAGARVPHLEL